ncbi:MAG: ferredoxin--NADP(+) reductase [Azospirillum brasilense]|nr:MAG: ferredoxin--NADP(+) reductase [Azospirillum brasilense]
MTIPHSTTHETDVAIIGAGPVGLFAIFELGMLKIRAHVIDTLPAVGGQCSALYPEKPIYDIPGFLSIEGQGLIDNLAAQAAPFDPVYHLDQQVTLVEKRDGGWRVGTNKGTVIDCKAVIIAAGCGAFGPNRPPLANIEQFEGTSVHYMVAKREDFRDQTLVIAGGGDSAVDWANSLAEVAKKIYMVHRRDKFRAMPESVSKMQALAEAGKIEFVVPYQLESLAGVEVSDSVAPQLREPLAAGVSEAKGGQAPLLKKKLTAVGLKSMDGSIREVEADHLLAFFGLSMELGPIANWGLNLHGNHIATQVGTSATSAPGIFAIGDIATYPHKLKLILCGFAEAAQAAHAIREIVYPGVAHHFEYSTSKGVPAAA